MNLYEIIKEQVTTRAVAEQYGLQVNRNGMCKCPFHDSALYVPFVIENRNETQGKLSPKGIFNTVIWPLSEEQKRICRVAKYTEEHMLAAPCDQRYTVEDMQLIANEICKAVRGQIQ